LSDLGCQRPSWVGGRDPGVAVSPGLFPVLPCCRNARSSFRDTRRCAATRGPYPVRHDRERSCRRLRCDVDPCRARRLGRRDVRRCSRARGLVPRRHGRSWLRRVLGVGLCLAAALHLRIGRRRRRLCSRPVRGEAAGCGTPPNRVDCWLPCRVARSRSCRAPEVFTPDPLTTGHRISRNCPGQALPRRHVLELGHLAERRRDPHRLTHEVHRRPTCVHPHDSTQPIRVMRDPVVDHIALDHRRALRQEGAAGVTWTRVSR
jgi:hypothetical protein